VEQRDREPEIPLVLGTSRSVVAVRAVALPGAAKWLLDRLTLLHHKQQGLAENNKYIFSWPTSRRAGS